jgi:hypothetical protein
MLFFLIYGETTHNAAKNNLIDVIALQEIRLILKDEFYHILCFSNNFWLYSNLTTNLFDSILCLRSYCKSDF